MQVATPGPVTTRSPDRGHLAKHRLPARKAVQETRADMAQDGRFAEKWDGAVDQSSMAVERAGGRRVGIGAVSHHDEFTGLGHPGTHLR
mgnify:CR=1 FL=1